MENIDGSLVDGASGRRPTKEALSCALCLVSSLTQEQTIDIQGRACDSSEDSYRTCTLTFSGRRLVSLQSFPSSPSEELLKRVNQSINVEDKVNEIIRFVSSEIGMIPHVGERGLRVTVESSPEVLDASKGNPVLSGAFRKLSDMFRRGKSSNVRSKEWVVEQEAGTSDLANEVRDTLESKESSIFTAFGDSRRTLASLVIKDRKLFIYGSMHEKDLESNLEAIDEFHLNPNGIGYQLEGLVAEDIAHKMDSLFARLLRLDAEDRRYHVVKKNMNKNDKRLLDAKIRHEWRKK